MTVCLTVAHVNTRNMMPDLSKNRFQSAPCALYHLSHHFENAPKIAILATFRT